MGGQKACARDKREENVLTAERALRNKDESNTQKKILKRRHKRKRRELHPTFLKKSDLQE